jgi:hypothetical protein
MFSHEVYIQILVELGICVCSHGSLACDIIGLFIYIGGACVIRD